MHKGGGKVGGEDETHAESLCYGDLVRITARIKGAGGGFPLDIGSLLPRAGKITYHGSRLAALRRNSEAVNFGRFSITYFRIIDPTGYVEAGTAHPKLLRSPRPSAAFKVDRLHKQVASKAAIVPIAPRRKKN